MAKARVATLKTMLSDEARYCSPGDTVHYNNPAKLFTACDGSFIYDDKGKPYLDLQMWYSAVNLGYRNPDVAKVLFEQMQTLPQLASSYLHPTKISLSKKLVQRTQKSFGAKGKIHFNVGGSQAVEDSIKLLRRTTGKSRFFAFEGSYHGRTLGATELTASYRYRKPYGSFANRAEFVPYPYCFRCPYGKKLDSCNYYCVDQFERRFESESGSFLDTKTNESEFGAFYIEAVQGTGGYIFPPPQYFKRLKKVLDKYNILMVDDEIQMGFYRTGKFWALEHYGVTPDVITFGKALTNGMNPLSGFWAKEKLLTKQAFPAGSTHSTFASNPLGTAAGDVVMDLMAKSSLESRIEYAAKQFDTIVKKLQKKYKVIGDVEVRGLAIRLEICQKDGYTPNRELTDLIYAEGLKGNLLYKGKRMGLVLDIGGHYKNVFTLSPALNISDSEIAMADNLLNQLFKKFA